MIIFSNVTLNRVVIILIYLNLTKNIWVLLGKWQAEVFCFYRVRVQSKYCTILVYQSHKSSDQALEKLTGVAIRFLFSLMTFLGEEDLLTMHLPYQILSKVSLREVDLS